MELTLEESRRSTPVQRPSDGPSHQISEPESVEGQDTLGTLSTPGDLPEQVSGEVRLIHELRQELDGYFVQLKRLSTLTPDEVFGTLSAMSARLVEIRGRLWRVDTRRCQALRSREVDPLIEEIDRQFKLHSRAFEVQKFDFEMSKGQP